MKTDWEQDELLVTIPVQDAQQLQLRLQKQGSAVHIKAWKTITKEMHCDGDNRTDAEGSNRKGCFGYIFSSRASICL
ncbi:MAG: hypothetical protein ACLRL6_15095 [Clostridium sp.]